MIKKAFWITSIFSLFLTIGTLVYYFHADDLYKKQILQLQPAKKKPSLASQKRSGVQKDLYITQNKERIHLCLQSKISEVFLFQKKKKTELMESLQGIEGFIQDKIETKASNQQFQQLRYFRSNHGTYFFPSHQFQSDEIALGFFYLPGSEMPTSVDLSQAYLRGSAEKISFFLNDKKVPYLEASHFKAEFKR
ncbi:MAG: hypothetical protein WCP39_04910 [Chlamydiota bacterium]